MAGGIAYVPCMDGRKRRVETEVWQLVMSSGPTGIFVGVWGERCRAIDGFIVFFHGCTIFLAKGAGLSMAL